MEWLLPLIIVAIVGFIGPKLTMSNRRKPSGRVVTPAAPTALPAEQSEPDATQHSLPPVQSVIKPTDLPSARSHGSVPPLPANGASEPVATPAAEAGSDLMRHFDLRQAMLYSEIMTPKF